MPALWSACSAAGPTPLMARTGMGARNDASCPGYTTVRPRGLSRSDATLAMDFVVPTPMEHVTPSSATRRWMRAAMLAGCSVFSALGLTSAKASSMDTCCTWGVSSPMIAMMARDTSR